MRERDLGPTKTLFKMLQQTELPLQLPNLKYFQELCIINSTFKFIKSKIFLQL